MITTDISITTTNPTIAANVTGQSTATIAVITANPTITANAMGVYVADIAVTTANPTIAANAMGVYVADIAVTTANPVISVIESATDIVNIATTTTNPIIEAHTSSTPDVGISIVTQRPVINLGVTGQSSATFAITTSRPTIGLSTATLSAIVEVLPPVVPPAAPTPVRPALDCKPTSNWAQCRPWDITNQQSTNNIADLYNQEGLSIAGAKVNVYKLLGIHEQTLLTDLTGQGTPISGGDAANYPALNAFNKLSTEWHSRQSGSALITSGYIGYDFGIIKMPNGRARYGVDTGVYHEITTIKIKQSSVSTARVTKARVERSLDGTHWFGVAIVNLPDDDVLNTIHFKQSAPARYWRLRPIAFNGDSCGSWGVQALELIDYAFTDISNIQDKILLENRDRDYSPSATTLKGYYELMQANSSLKQFGIELEANYSIKVNFNTCVALLGRPIVVGDIIELPSEQQYTTSLQAVKRYLEVTDVTWDPTSYTPGWVPLMLLITALPALASQETQDIFGDLASKVDTSGLFTTNDGNNTKYQDFTNIDQANLVMSLQNVPERGSEGSNTLREFEESELAAADAVNINLRPISFQRTGLYVEDAMPQNGAPYTEGPDMPQNPKDGDYHRMTYVGLSQNVPARLYRFSLASNRWVYLETDRRAEYNKQKELLTEYITSPNAIPARDIK